MLWGTDAHHGVGREQGHSLQESGEPPWGERKRKGLAWDSWLRSCGALIFKEGFWL